mgnify:CR=1 FL=1
MDILDVQIGLGTILDKIQSGSIVIDDRTNRYCNTKEMDCNQRRRYKGYYQFNISDNELLNLQRAEWIKG